MSPRGAPLETPYRRRSDSSDDRPDCSVPCEASGPRCSSSHPAQGDRVSIAAVSPVRMVITRRSPARERPLGLLLRSAPRARRLRQTGRFLRDSRLAVLRGWSPLPRFRLSAHAGAPQRVSSSSGRSSRAGHAGHPSHDHTARRAGFCCPGGRSLAPSAEPSTHSLRLRRL